MFTVDLGERITDVGFSKYFLGIHEERVPISHVARGIDNLGSVNWEMVACVVLVYLICYFSLWKGIKMSGKVSVSAVL